MNYMSRLTMLARKIGASTFTTKSYQHTRSGQQTHSGQQTRTEFTLALGFAALLLGSAPALAATAPDLGTTSSYAIISSTFTNTTAGTSVGGDVCYTTPPAVAASVTGAIAVPCPPLTGTDQNAARNDLTSQACTPIGAAVALNEISIGGGRPRRVPPQSVYL